jgi:nitrogen fixation protein NifU and related proteins
MNDLYQEIILEEARHPQNYGVLDNPDVVVHERNASCGDEVTLYLKLDETKKQIIDLKWQGHGCIISQASMSALSGKIKSENVSLAKVQKLSKNQIEELLGIEEISPGRLKCLLLGLHTFKQV